MITQAQILAVKDRFGIVAESDPQFFTMGQWTTLIWPNMAECRVNFVPDTCNMRFSAYVAKAGVNYDAFLEYKEPSLAMWCPPSAMYNAPEGFDVFGEAIAGIICQGDGAPRFSLSNPNAPKFSLGEDGQLMIGEEIWYLHTLQRPDAMRVRNYNAYFGREPVERVNVVELGNFPMFQS